MGLRILPLAVQYISPRPLLLMLGSNGNRYGTKIAHRNFIPCFIVQNLGVLRFERNSDLLMVKVHQSSTLREDLLVCPFKACGLQARACG